MRYKKSIQNKIIMKNLAFTILILFLVYGTASSQSCLPEGITFSTQEQIDNFQINHPGCTEIEGNVKIHGNDITNLNGLNVLTTIGGFLRIWGNASLVSLTGLENLTSIKGHLIIGDFQEENLSLSSLTGLDNVTSIGGHLSINNNDALTSLTGLDNVTSIGGDLSIWDNDALTSLEGLDNIGPASIDRLFINDNSSLSACEVQSVCDYLVSPFGAVNIYNNASGCNNPAEVANACGFTMPCLPYGTYHLLSQTDIDDFQNNYIDCTELMGAVYIEGSDITNLNGLSVVTSIEAGLVIHETDSLKNLTGLDNLTSIGANLIIGHYSINNYKLASLTGLENLTSIGGVLSIKNNPALISLSGLDNVISIGGGLAIYNNDFLTSLTGLNNVTSIGGWLEIDKNNVLTGLTGLNNINANSITSLYITVNNSLSMCEVQSVCDYLVSPNGTIEIFNNAPGCDSQEEVEEACEGVSVENLNPDGISIFPNPANRQLTIFSNDRTIEEVIIYNQTGQKVLYEKGSVSTIDISNLQSGMYIVEVVSGQKSIREKLMIE